MTLDHWDTGFKATWYLVSAPDPGCECTASTSPKTLERYIITLFNEYDQSYWLVIIDHKQKKSNWIYTRFFLHFFFRLSIRRPASPIKSPIKTIIITSHHFHFEAMLEAIRLYREKWIILRYHSSYGKIQEAVNSQNSLCWIRCTSQ